LFINEQRQAYLHPLSMSKVRCFTNALSLHQSLHAFNYILSRIRVSYDACLLLIHPDPLLLAWLGFGFRVC
jgi:hypothetical protein